MAHHAAAPHRRARMRGWRRLIGVVATALAMGVPAQEHREAALPPGTADAVALDATLVRTGLYLISGGGANTLLRFSTNGLILVDAKMPGTYRALKSQVRRIAKISDLPVRVLLVTDHHAAHIGNAGEFMAAGATVVAQRNAEPYLRPLHSGATPAPVLTFERQYTLRLGGVEAQVMHPGRAQTDDAAVVLFPDLRVVAVGDLFTHGPPQPDFVAGGSLAEWPSVLGAVLKLDFDLVVPGTGPMVTRADLERFKARIEALISRATALVRAGVTRDQLMARLTTDDPGWPLELAGDQLERFHAELARQP